MNRIGKILLWMLLPVTMLLSQETTGGRTDSARVNFGGREAGMGAALNLKYGYPVASLNYLGRRGFWHNTIRMRYEFEGYRITRFILPEYNRLLVQADYRIPLPDRGRYRHHLLPRGGLLLTFDIYDENSPAKWFRYAPVIGMDYEGRLNRLRVHLANTVSLFSDGFWYELKPGISFRTYKSLFLKLNINIIMAYTYNGNSGAGFFPGLSIQYIPD